jgi:hypothetical protein
MCVLNMIVSYAYDQAGCYFRWGCLSNFVLDLAVPYMRITGWDLGLSLDSILWCFGKQLLMSLSA